MMLEKKRTVGDTGTCNDDTVKKERAVATVMLEKKRTVDDTGTWKRRVASSMSINESRGRDEHL